MRIGILLALVCLIIGPGGLPASAEAPLEIQWSDLLPVDVVEDPFEKLSRDQLQDLGHMVRIQTLIAAGKIKPNGAAAREAAEIQQRLEKSGIDIAWFLSQRKQVERLRKIQASSVQPSVLGQVVRIAGFVVPLKRSGNLVTEFLLVPNFDACYHSAPPPPNQAVFVQSGEGIPIQGPITAARVTGRIQAKRTERVIQRTDGPTIVSAAYVIAPQSIEISQAKASGASSDTNGIRIVWSNAPPMPAPLPAHTSVLQRIAFGSCAKHWQYQPIWETVITKTPDLFLFLGDAVYADTDGKTAWSVTEKQLQGEWHRLADKPEFQRFRAQIPIMATWDNHDYGTHNGGAEFELKEVSKRIFLDFFGEPQQSERRQRAGIYDAKVFGPKGRRVQIILLDTRTFRGPFKRDARSKEERAKIGKVGVYLPHDNAESQILGDSQWAWLEKQLGKPAQIRLVCSSTQVIPDQKGMDEWGCFPRDRQRLFNLIEETHANGVILLSGNVHFAEISRARSEEGRILEFTSSGLTHINKSYAGAANQFRIAGPFAELNFGLVEIDWTAKPTAQITLRAISDDGSIGFTHRVSLDALQ